MGHRFVPSPDADPAHTWLDPEQTQAIKRWTNEVLKLGEDDVVTVSELACLDEGCPLVETVVTVYSPGIIRAWTFTRPKFALTKLMLQQTLATPARISKG